MRVRRHIAATLGAVKRWMEEALDTSRTHKKIGIVRLIAYNIAIVGLLMVITEGLASYTLLIRDLIKTLPIAEQRHTRYDRDLGWVNIASLYVPDMYGRGVYLRTNVQGFRNDHDIATAVPSGRARLICSGDSFTFGYGVDNAHTWCEQLSLLEPRLETVNMGQGGYGVDQAYLWYKRDAAKIEHQVQILAFITNDLTRMQSDSFSGYPKPVVDLEDGALVFKNVPVPRFVYYFPWNPQNASLIKQLRIVEFLNRGLEKLRDALTDDNQVPKAERNGKLHEVLHKLLEDLKNIDEQRSSRLVLVYLPTDHELGDNGPREWTEFLKEESRSLGIPFINLFSEFRSLSENDLVKLFIPRGQLTYRGAEGHFNEAGNMLVARIIYDKLMNDPAIFDALSARWNHRQPASRPAVSFSPQVSVPDVTLYRAMSVVPMADISEDLVSGHVSWLNSSETTEQGPKS
jgi:hypothetical protein